MIDQADVVKKPQSWFIMIYPAVFGWLIAVLCCWAIIGMHNKNKAVERKVQLWDAEFREKGSPITIKIEAEDSSSCLSLLYIARSSGFLIEIDGHHVENSNDIVQVCKWFDGAPTATLSKSGKWWEY